MIKILYRELHYQMVKSNPMVANDEKKLEKQLKKSLDMKKNVLRQSIGFLFFGVFTASSIYLADSESMMIGVLASLALIPLILSIYQTTIQVSYLTSLDIFDPMKALPVKLGGKFLSGVISIDLLPGLIIVVPSAVVLMIKNPLSGVLALLWLLVGVLIGHTIGLGIFSVFGLKIINYKGKFGFLKNIAKTIGLILVMGMFFMVIYLQDYIIQQSQFIVNHSIIYPLSVASVFDPIYSILLLLGHVLIIIPLYFYFIKKLWSGILEPEVITEGKVETDYKISVKNPITSLIYKDYRIISRKTSMIAGFLLPLYIIIPQIFIGIEDGTISMFETTGFVFIVGIMTIAGADAILKVEGKTIDFLKTLPVTKKQFAMSKAVSMCLIPTILELAVISLGLYFNSKVVYLLPLALILPFTSALVTMAYLYRYKGEEIGTPEFNYKKMFILFIIVGILFGVIAMPILILDFMLKYFISYGIAFTSAFLIYRFMKR
ncbi:MAG: hypothetical protein ACOC6U_02015 [Thermoplasmatota archaeon]